MSEISPRLSLPFLLPSQAQKHVTHNEALSILDALVQTSVTEFDVDTPPITPAEGDIYALGPLPVGDWDGEAGMLALRQNGGWVFVQPLEGWRAWDGQNDRLMAYVGGSWVPVAGETNNLDGIGIGTSWDVVNRLALASEASLFSHDGAGHQIKVNKAGTADTASLLFQSGWTGHAEMGLSGDNVFSVKVSADGTTWDEPVRIDPVAQTIQADYPVAGLAVQQSATDVTAGRLMRADWGYGPGNAVGLVTQAGGVPTGAVIETGSNANGYYTRWADGTQMCWVRSTLSFDTTQRLYRNWTFPAAFSAPHFPSIQANLEKEHGTAPGPSAYHGPYARQGNSPNPNGCTVRLYRSDGATDFDPADTLPVQVSAIGRWF